ncbi:MAG: STAS domain-containing protein [Roseococcus sp.]|nr:STAS domain-containing protein [Roseococcus sp.]
MIQSADPADVIELSGPLTIATVEATRDLLLTALQPPRDLRLDCSGGTRFDIAFVQMLEAARRQLAAQGATLRLAAGTPAALLAVLAEGGFAGWDAGVAEARP